MSQSQQPRVPARQPIPQNPASKAASQTNQNPGKNLPTSVPSGTSPPAAPTEEFAAPEAPHGAVQDEMHDLYASVNLQALMQYDEENPNAPDPFGLDSPTPGAGASAVPASVGVSPLKPGTTNSRNPPKQAIPSETRVAGPAAVTPGVVGSGAKGSFSASTTANPGTNAITISTASPKTASAAQSATSASGLGSQLVGAIAAPVIGSLLTGGGGIKK